MFTSVVMGDVRKLKKVLINIYNTYENRKCDIESIVG